MTTRKYLLDISETPSPERSEIDRRSVFVYTSYRATGRPVAYKIKIITHIVQWNASAITDFLSVSCSSQDIELKKEERSMQLLIPGLLYGTAIFIVFSLLWLVRRIVWLRFFGVRIVATVTDVTWSLLWHEPSPGYRYQRSVYCIFAEWQAPQTNRVYTFRSDGHTTYPGRYTPGSPINVLIDPSNPDIYQIVFDTNDSMHPLFLVRSQRESPTEMPRRK